MKQTRDRLGEGLRIIWAIAAKDIADAIKNKTVITIVLAVTMTMLMSQALPLLLGLSMTNSVIVSGQVDAQLVAAMVASSAFRTQRVSSEQEMTAILGESRLPQLGLVIPADIDQSLAAGDSVTLDAYFAHSTSRAKLEQLELFFEQQLAELAGRPIEIRTEGHAVYPQADSTGTPFMIAISLVIAILTMSGFLVPHLMLEERETKTINVLLVSPASYSQVVAGKALAGTVYGLTAAVVLLAFNHAAVVHWGLMIVAELCGTLFAVAVGLLLGVIFENPQQLSLWMSVIFVLLFIPMFAPLFVADSWPAVVRLLLPRLPSAALLETVRLALCGSVPLAQVMENLAIIVASGLLMLAAVVAIVRRSDR